MNKMLKQKNYLQSYQIIQYKPDKNINSILDEKLQARFNKTDMDCKNKYENY